MSATNLMMESYQMTTKHFICIGRINGELLVKKLTTRTTTLNFRDTCGGME